MLKRLLIYVSVFLLLFGLLLVVHVGKAGADTGFDICTVLKAEFDTQNVVYDVWWDWEYFTFPSGSHMHDSTRCHFEEKPGVDAYGPLCSIREGHLTPPPGFTVGKEGPVPWGETVFACPG